MIHTCGITIHGYPTDIAITVYRNHIFIIATHFKKIGSLVSVTRESTLNRFSSNIFSTKILFGKDDTDIHVAARYIAEQINIDKPLLLSLSLKDYNIEILKAITAVINEKKLW